MPHKEGDTPARTPATRTKLAFFKAPQAEGTIHYGEESWPIAAGVVECPLEVGEPAGWPRVYGEDVEAHQRALTAPPESLTPAAEGPGAILQGSIADVVAHLATVTDADALDAFQAAELAGKNRKGVFEAIAGRLEALTAPPDSLT
jgi:hypothetical protein